MEKNLILQKAKSAEMSRDFATAERLYKQLIESDPSNVDYLRAVGGILVQAGEDERAISYYEQIISYYPHYTDAMNSLGAIYRRLKRYDEAISILQRALDEDRQLPTVNYNLGFTYKDMGNYEDAIDCFNYVIQKNPNDVLAYNHLGSIYLTLKDFEKSISSFKHGLTIDPNHPILNYNLARCYEASKDIPNAIRYYSRALKIRPGWKDAINDFSRLLMKCQKNKDAQDIVEQAIKLHSDDVDLKCLLGDIFINQYDYESAAEVYKQANVLTEKDPAIMLGLADAYEKQNKTNQAIELLQGLLDQDPDNLEAKQLYTNVMLDENQTEEALSYIQNIQECVNNPKDLKVLDLYGQYYVCAGDDAKAAEYANKIKFINHHYKDHMLHFAKRYAQLQKWEKAEEYANKYVEARPQNPDGFMSLGLIYEMKGDYIGAKNFFGKSANMRVPNVLAKKKIASLTDKLNDLDNYVSLQEIDPNEIIETVDLEDVPETNNDLVAADDFDFDQVGGAGDETPKDSEYFENLAADIEDKFAKEEDEDVFEIQDPDKMNLVDEDSEFDFNQKDDDVDPLKADNDEKFFVDGEEFSPQTALPEMAKMSEEAKGSAVAAREAADNAQRLMEQLQAQQAAMAEQLQEQQSMLKEQMMQNAQHMVKEAVCDFLETPMPEEMIPETKSEAEPETETVKVPVEQIAEQPVEQIAEQPVEQFVEVEDELPETVEVTEAAVQAEPEEGFDITAADITDIPEIADIPDMDNVPDIPVRNTTGNSISVNEMLEKIQKILQDDKIAKQNEEKLELFRTLRVLSNFLPESEKNSFQSCRMRMMIEYIIAKLSGKPGLLKTTQSLIKSGVLGDEYTSQLVKESEQEMGNELIRRVITDMKKMAESLEDKTLATSLMVTADGILEQIELKNQKAAIF